jgi:hypothetical protein
VSRVRAKIHWFRAEAAKGPAEVASALGFLLWGVARRMLASLRKADFDIDAGPRYFAFLAEALAFEIQIAWRVAYERYSEEERTAFAHGLARDVARILAENEAELLGIEASAAIEKRFIALLNRRFEEYAEFGHDAAGPTFAFLRYFASLVAELVPAKDQAWIHDQVIAIEGPEAAAMVAKAVTALNDTGPGRQRRTRPASVGE